MRIEIPHLELLSEDLEEDRRVFNLIRLGKDMDEEGDEDLETSGVVESGYNILAPPMVSAHLNLVSDGGFYSAKVCFCAQGCTYFRNLSSNLTKEFANYLSSDEYLWVPMSKDGAGHLYGPESNVPFATVCPYSVGGSKVIGRMISIGNNGAEAREIVEGEGSRIIEELQALERFSNIFLSAFYKKHPEWVEKNGLNGKVSPLEWMV